MSLEVWVNIVIALVGLCALESWVFVALYSRVAWYRSAEGRHLMRVTTLLGLTYSLTLFNRLVEPKPLTIITLSLLLFGWTAWELGVRISLHVKARREASAARSAAKE